MEQNHIFPRTSDFQALTKAGTLELFFSGLADFFRDLGADYCLVTGIALPNRALQKLVLHDSWGVPCEESLPLSEMKGNDPFLRQVTSLQLPKIWHFEGGATKQMDCLRQSELAGLVLPTGNRRTQTYQFAAFHLHHFAHFQIALCLAGSDLNLSQESLAALHLPILTKLQAFDQQQSIQPSRQGSLSVRERKVLQLTAQGKTALDIATLLDISQRTVHAHLQNAADKLKASNKTHTVTEAIRYGQIAL